MKNIDSIHNLNIKHLVKLQTKRHYRQIYKQTVAYGEHLIYEAQKYKLIKSIFVYKEAKDKYQQFFNHEMFLISDTIMNKINILDSQIDIIAIINLPQTSQQNIYLDDCVVLDSIQNPGNLGTILRACSATNIKNIILSNTCVDAYSPKVLRSSQGLQFNLNIISLDIISFLMQYKNLIIATKPKASSSIYQLDLSQNIALVFGNEGSGISHEVLANIKTQVTIPMQVESLNVAMAATVCLFEMARQRYEIHNH